MVNGVPRLDDADIDALVAFLQTLTDSEFQLASAENGTPSGQQLAGRR